MIITIARQSGSGGYTVGKILADKYGIPVYDQTSLSQLAKEKGVYDTMRGFFDEFPVNSLMYALSMDFRNKKFTEPERDALEHLIPEKDFVLIGRCGNYIFKNRPDCVSVFVHGELDYRVWYKTQLLHISQKEALEIIHRADDNRLAYHRYYTGTIWGEAKNYDISIDTSRIGHQAAATLIDQYIQNVKAAQKRKEPFYPLK